jgi:hypothetical protein
VFYIKTDKAIMTLGIGRLAIERKRDVTGGTKIRSELKYRLDN